MKRPRNIDELIANGDRLVRQAEEIMAEHERLLAEHGIDPRDALEFVRRHLGEEAVQAVQARVDDAVRQIEAGARESAARSEAPRPSGQRARVRTNLI